MTQVSNDMKVTIGKIAASQAVAIEPGQNIMLTRSLLRWVKTGLAVKYNGTMSQAYKEMLAKNEALWIQAMQKFGSTNESWPVALMMCADIADEMCIIAGKEDLMDYTEFNYNLTDSLYGHRDDDEDDKEDAHHG